MHQCWKEVSGTIPENEQRWMARMCMGRRLHQRRWRLEGIQRENIKVPDGRMAKEAHAWPLPETDQRPVQWWYLAMASGRGTQETEGMIMAAQDQVLRTRYIRGTNISPICKKCNHKDETINHIASERPALVQNQYKKRHDTGARAVHWNLCKKYQMSCSNKWYEHQPQPVTENENAKLLWDYGIRPDRVIPAHQPNLTLVDKTNKISLIDVAEQKEQGRKKKKKKKKKEREIKTKTYELS